MDIKVRTIIFDTLTPKQVDELIDKLEDLAKEKHANVTQYYLSRSEQTDFPEDLEDMIDKSDWTDFLPLEYAILIQKKHEETKEEAV